MDIKITGVIEYETRNGTEEMRFSALTFDRAIEELGSIERAILKKQSEQENAFNDQDEEELEGESEKDPDDLRPSREEVELRS